MSFSRTLIITLLIVVFANFLQAQNKDVEQLKKEAFGALKKGQNDTARVLFQQIIDEYPNNLKLVGLSYNNLGIIAIREGLASIALDHFEQAHNVFLRTKNDTLIAQSFYNYGASFKRLGQYDTSAALITKALVFFEENNMLLNISQAFNLLGNVYKETGNLELALEYHNKAIENAIELNDSLQLAKYINNRGNTYTEMEFFDEALNSFNYSLSIKNRLGNRKSQANTLYNIGDVYAKKSLVDSSIFYLNKALIIRKEIDNKRGIAYCLNYLGHLYSLSNQVGKAENYLVMALSMADSLGLQDLIKSNYDYQQQHFERNGDLKKSLSYFRLLKAQEERLLNIKKQKQIRELEIKYQVEKREQENELLLKENQIQALEIEKEEAKVTVWKNNFLIITIISLLILISTIWLYRLFIREKALKQREKQFAVEQHHRIKNHLQVLGGMLSFQHRKLEDLGAKEALEESKNRVSVMTTLHQSLYNPEISTNSTVKLNVYLQQIIDHLSIVFDRKDINSTSELEEIQVPTDLALPIGLVVNEIISNSYKYAKNEVQNTELSIKLLKKSGFIVLELHDNGKWISPKKSKNSIGIELIQQLIKQMDGKLRLDKANGTNYVIEILLK